MFLYFFHVPEGKFRVLQHTGIMWIPWYQGYDFYNLGTTSQANLEQGDCYSRRYPVLSIEDSLLLNSVRPEFADESLFGLAVKLKLLHM